MSYKKDTLCRKWQLTINNPLESNFTHEQIKLKLSEFKSLIYWCMSDEIGENGTYHTHIYIQGKSVIRFSMLKKRFDIAHIEMARGTAQENYDYITKTGKWGDTKKKETSVPDTFEEWGELPVERRGQRNDIADLYAMLKEGLSTYEILEENPTYLLNVDKIDRVRQIILEEKYKNARRNLEVVYIYGKTRTGKTRSVMDKFGYSNVFRVTDYDHPFDNYKGQDVVVFDEFRSSLPFIKMLDYLDNYPVELSCRYNNKVACFTKIFIITNIPLSSQYPNIQESEPASWQAFLSRIHKIVKYESEGVFFEEDKNLCEFKKATFERVPFDDEVVNYYEQQKMNL